MSAPTSDRAAPLQVFLVATEASGDLLGAHLMAALAEHWAVRFAGVGGPAMAAEGLESLFPMEDVMAMGIGAVLAKAPTIHRRLHQTVAAIVAARPDLLIMIDSPDFTHRVARRVRRALPELSIVKYVAPTVWAWRPGRARAMRPDFDRVLALYPFEPEAMRRLGGPPTTDVGHPLLERLAELRPSAAEFRRREQEPPLVLILPGSRKGELARHAAIFGEAAGRIAAGRTVEFVLPTLPELAQQIASAISSWPVRPRVVTSEADKFSALRNARAALAASGTVTLELALAHVPMVTAYRVPLIEAFAWKLMVRVSSPILPNIVLGENVVPCFLQYDCTAENLSAALLPLLGEGAERRRQLEAFSRLDAAFGAGGEVPSVRAARAVIETFEEKTGRQAPAR